MRIRRQRQIASMVALLIAALSLSACSSQQSSGKVSYKQTAEASLDKGMDNQPEAPYWFPNQLLKWQFSKDKQAKYNVATVPLAKRIDKWQLPTVNKTQDPKMKVVALSIMNASTSGNAPRGINTFDANVFSNWQYIDQLVYWGGSAGEGLIVPPTADVIDAAHKNGVPVLGTVFFPQVVSGGKLKWLNDFLKQDKDGHFPMADKLVAVAKAYGFDGWFINQETDPEVKSFDSAASGKNSQSTTKSGLTKKHAQLMQQLIKEYKQKAGSKLDLMWYDSMTKDGKMDWQNALTKENQSYLVDANMKPVADSMFLNFWWTKKRLASQDLLKKSRDRAEKLGLNPYNLFAGIDVQADGTSTPVRWDLFANQHNVPYTSLGLYAPNWTYTSSETPDEFQSKEETLWVNSHSDPSRSVPSKTSSQWPGVSTYAVEKSAITKQPFVTNFSLGNGYNYFIKGRKVSLRDWNNRSLQAINPTYRWMIDNPSGNDLKAAFDYTDAYDGGNDIQLSGQMRKNKTSTIKLYTTDIPFTTNTQVKVAAKATDKTQLDLVVTLKDGRKKTIKGDQALSSKWQTIDYDVSGLAKKTVKSISLSLTTSKSDTSYRAQLGRLAITGKPQASPTAVKSVAIDNRVFDEEGKYAGVNLSWQAASTKHLDHYEIYQRNQNGSRSFLGATDTTNFYLNALERTGQQNETDLMVVPVDIWNQRGPASKVTTLKWPDNRKPKAAFTVDRTLASPGSTIKFTNTSSKNATSFKWQFTGAKQTSSTAKNPTITYAKAGTYNVTLTAKNNDGQRSVTMKKLITITPKAKGALTVLSKNAKTSASGYTNSSEAPKMAVDGKLSTKWCATGKAPHTLTLDLGHQATVSAVKLAHAKAGGESADMNTKAWTIQVSTDGKHFKDVARTYDNTKATSLNTFAETTARYVRIVVDKPTQVADTAVRIYEMDVLGLNSPLK
ncbi:endo-beta-N-acetylglucosaminidase [Lactiplantibacillus pentosus]|uniref:endo-beta-N-acetylglucosaminidase n=1 Tax=Lactiplantibacillus pentosus TaxID=1589 RepID=UPI0021A50BBA|nr:discoidin domain-containing protein [Lactiplantibacillus pentosus]MCT3305182.1 PKD domain-containing protein [Lactiplantibacillus pentosus]